MRKRFKAKVSGVFDIVQLSDSTFSEVRDKLKENNYQIDQQFTSRDECYIEAYGDNGMRCVNRGDMVFTDDGVACIFACILYKARLHCIRVRGNTRTR